MNRFKPTASHRRKPTIGGQLARALAAAILAAAVVTATAAAGTTACGICGKNLIKNPGADAGARDHRGRRLRSRPGLDERGGAVRRRVVHVPERLVLEELEGLAEARQELLLRGHDDEGRRGQGDDREADDQAPGGRGGSQGDAQRLARQLREELRAGASAVRGRRRPGAQGGQDRPGHDDLGHRHAATEPQPDSAARAPSR